MTRQYTPEQAARQKQYQAERHQAKKADPEYIARRQAESARYHARKPVVRLLANAKARAIAFGLPFAITAADIAIPQFCPILGIPLFRGDGVKSDNSPSLDRMRPERGYVPGNVHVISERANRIKSNGTAEEHRLIAAYMDANQ